MLAKLGTLRHGYNPATTIFTMNTYKKNRGGGGAWAARHVPLASTARTWMMLILVDGTQRTYADFA
jgi:hypothetical protein